jgi:hypothetical protein
VEPLFRETDLVDELSFFGIKAPQSAERDKFLTLHVLVWAISECKGGVLTKDFSQVLFVCFHPKVFCFSRLTHAKQGPSPGKDSYVKTVQIDLYGKCGVEAELLEEVARTYPVRNSEGKNPLELKVPNKIANKFSVAVINPSNDVQLFLLFSLVC